MTSTRGKSLSNHEDKVSLDSDSGNWPCLELCKAAADGLKSRQIAVENRTEGLHQSWPCLELLKDAADDINW